MSIMCDPQTPAGAPVYLPDFQDAETLRHQLTSQQQQQQQALIENRGIPQYLPPGSPQTHRLLQHQNSSQGMFTFTFPSTAEQQFQQQLLQRLQSLSGYTNPLRPQPSPGYSVLPQSSVYQQPASLYQPQQVSPTQIGFRVSQASSYSGSPVMTHRQQTLDNGPVAAESGAEEPAQFIRPLSQSGTLTTTDTDGRLRVLVPVAGGDDRSNSPQPPRLDPPPSGPRRQPQTQDNAAGVSPATAAKRQQNQLAAALSSMVTLRVSDDSRRGPPNGPPFIKRATSEKVPNRSELMSQVQRTAWARHTTK